MIERDAVVWTYRLLLGREPESEATIAAHCAHPDLAGYVAATMQSPEFRARHAATVGLSKAWVWTEIADGALLRVNLSDAAISWPAVEGAFEPAEVAFVRSVVRPGSVALDIGANLGFFTILIASLVGPQGHVHAFEPMPVLFDSLAKSIARNGYEARTTLHNAAVSDHEGSALITSLDVASNWGGSRLVAPGSPVPAGHVTRNVPVHALDKALALPRLDIIKIDVEGHELLALKGARETITRFKPVILSEVAPPLLAAAGTSIRDYLALMASLGYRGHRLDANGGIGARFEDQGDDALINVVFVPI